MTIVVKPVRARKRLAAYLNRFANYVHTVVVVLFDLNRRIAQQVSLVATKIEHGLACPIGMAKLRVEVRKLRRLHKLRAQRALRLCTPPQMYFLDHQGCPIRFLCVSVVSVMNFSDQTQPQRHRGTESITPTSPSSSSACTPPLF